MTMTAERILVIDDEPNVIRFCQRALEKQGFELKGALSGEEGLQLLKGGGFDLTLLDVKLPGRDGLDVLSTIQEVDPEMAVIIITGHGTMKVAVRALRSGAQDFLLKPFTPEEFVASVQKVLEKRRLLQENLRLKARLPILEISKALISEMNLERLAQLTQGNCPFRDQDNALQACSRRISSCRGRGVPCRSADNRLSTGLNGLGNRHGHPPVLK